MGLALLWGGEFVKAHKHLNLSIHYFDATDVRKPVVDSGIHARALAANSALRLGYPDIGRQLLIDALDIAERHGKPYNEGFVHMCATLLHNSLRDPRTVLVHAEALSRLAVDNPTYSIFSDEHAGCALLMLGKREEGLARVRRGRASGEFALDRASTLALDAQVYASEGRIQDGLATIDEGLRPTEEVRFYESPLLRQRADFLLQAGAAGPENRSGVSSGNRVCAWSGQQIRRARIQQ